jgi:hypothetical protein
MSLSSRQCKRRQSNKRPAVMRAFTFAWFAMSAHDRWTTGTYSKANLYECPNSKLSMWRRGFVRPRRPPSRRYKPLHGLPKHHGAAFYAAAIFRQDKVNILGATRSYKGRHFCPRCGSSVFAQSDEVVEIHLGAMDNSVNFIPTYEGWTKRRA